MDALAGLSFISSLGNILPNVRLVHRINIMHRSGPVRLDDTQIPNTSSDLQTQMTAQANLQAWKAGILFPAFQAIFYTQNVNRFLEPIVFLNPLAIYLQGSQTEQNAVDITLSNTLYIRYGINGGPISAGIFLFTWD